MKRPSIVFGWLVGVALGVIFIILFERAAMQAMVAELRSKDRQIHELKSGHDLDRDIRYYRQHGTGLKL